MSGDWALVVVSVANGAEAPLFFCGAEGSKAEVGYVGEPTTRSKWIKPTKPAEQSKLLRSVSPPRTTKQLEGTTYTTDAPASQFDLHALLQTTLSHMTDAVVVVDAQSYVRGLNPAAEELTGWTDQKAWGKHVGEVVRLLTPQASVVISDVLDRVYREHESEVLTQQSVLIQRTGGAVCVTGRIAPITLPMDGLSDQDSADTGQPAKGSSCCCRMYPSSRMLTRNSCKQRKLARRPTGRRQSFWKPCPTNSVFH